MTVSLDVALPNVRIGCLAARVADSAPPEFDDLVGALVRERQNPLPDPAERVRLAARDMLRNGRYKPTGRGKPASEYLLRAAGAGTFPRINAWADICNYVSLRFMVPISVWDADKAPSDQIRVRLGREDEAYVFNASGQEIGLTDLLLGAAGDSPVVNPVKDSQATKTDAETTRVGALVYLPVGAMDDESQQTLLQSFSDLLGNCGKAAESAWKLCGAGETVVVDLP